MVNTFYRKNNFPNKIKAGRGRGWTSFVTPVLAIIISLFFMKSPTMAIAGETTGDAKICRQSARVAARKTGVPLSVLLAISLTETGRNQNGVLQPWPWTVNMEGRGLWFQNRFEALDFAQRNFARGARSFDIGCFQINYKWHGKAFHTLDQMFEPDANAIYAARYLQRLFQENGSWKSAAGAYHSQTPKLARHYAERFSRNWARFRAPDATISALPVSGAVTTEPRNNGYPLLKPQQKAVFQNGSLVILATRTGAHGLLVQSKGRLY